MLHNQVKLFIIIIGFMLSGLSFAQFNKVYQVSHPDDYQPAEVTIAINPKNPQNLVAAFMTHTKKFPHIESNTYISQDGGKTWLKIATNDPENRIQGDDGVTFSSEGTVYHSYLSFFGLFKSDSIERPSSGIYVSSSTNGGLSWYQRSLVVDHINTSAPMEDKPYVATDNAPDSPYKNNVYLAWTHFEKYASKNTGDSSQIYFSRSIDSGKTFSPHLRISTYGGDCLDGDNTVEGAITAAGPKGEVYVVWGGPRGLEFTKSLDGGKTFSKSEVFGYIHNGWDFDIKGILRANGMPVTKVDLSNGKYNGSIYVNWIDDRNGDPDVFVKYSRDGGKTWSNPVRVNDDSVGNGKDQFLTWMSVDPIDGSVNCVFYDRRDLDSTKTGVTLARSVDGGKTFKNYKINIEPFECNSKVFFGDYTGIDAYDGEVAPIFMHFISKDNLTVSTAIFQFEPGTLKERGKN